MMFDKKFYTAKLLADSYWLGHATKIVEQLKFAATEKVQFEALKMLSSEIDTKKVEGLDFSETETLFAIHGATIISSLHYREHTDKKVQKAFFKQSVTYMNIETSSQCNRKCLYCPNSFNDRFSENHFMKPAVYESIITDLSSIDYANTINFVGYNEPLMHREDLLKNIRMARAYLPKANLCIFTNGDYLTKDYLSDLVNAGVTSVRISVHDAPSAPYDQITVMDRIARLADKLGVGAQLLAFTKNNYIKFRLMHPSIYMEIFQSDLQNFGCNRGGVLKGVGQKVEKRTSACIFPLYQFIIGYTGLVVPCCELVPDDKIQQLFMGNVSESDIFTINSCADFAKMRVHTSSMQEKNSPCSSCQEEINMPLHNNADLFSTIACSCSPNREKE